MYTHFAKSVRENAYIILSFFFQLTDYFHELPVFMNYIKAHEHNFPVDIRISVNTSQPPDIHKSFD